jgi:catalase
MLHGRLFAYFDEHRYRIGSGSMVEQKKYRGPASVMPETAAGRFAQRPVRSDDYVQPGDLFRLMAEDAQDRLVDTIVTMMKPVRRDIQIRAVGNFAKCDPTLGERLSRGLDLRRDLGAASVVMAVAGR